MVINMSKKKLMPSVELSTIFIYAIISFAANYIGCLTYIITASALRGIQKSFAGVIVLAVIPMTVAVLLSSIYINRCISEQYQYSEGKIHWWQNFCIFIIPGELLRFIVSLCDLGHNSGTGWVTFTPSFIFENIYVYPNGLNTRIRFDMNYQLKDYMVYIGCYVIYLAIYTLLLLAIYHCFWKKLDFKYKELQKNRESDSKY